MIMQLNLKQAEDLLKSREEAFRRDKEAIERVLKMLKEQESAGDSESDQKEDESNQVRRRRRPEVIEIRKLSRDAVLSIGTGRLTIKDVMASIMAKYPEIDVISKRPQISQSLLTFVDKGLLKLVQRGVGKEPHVYEILNTK